MSSGDIARKLGITVEATDKASGTLSNVKREVAGIGNAGAGAGFSRFVGGIEKGASRMKSAIGGAASHFKHQMANIANVALAGLGIGGILSIGGAFEQGVSKAEALGLAVEKVSAATGLAAHPASQLVAVFDKFNIGADATATLLGRLEKNAFAAGKSAKDATKFQKEYGFSVVDSAGHVKDANQLLLSAADYFNRNTNAAQRDAAMAKLFGKTWLDLAPVLKLGSKGIAEAAQEADKLGLTLKTAQDVTNVKNFIAAQRDAKDALGGLEVQLGLLVMPDLTTGLKTFTGFIASHQGDIKHVFSDALTVAEHFGSFITGTVVPDIKGLAGAAIGFWNGIPAPLRDLLVKGVVADRTMKFLFGVSPIQVGVHLAEDALGGLAGAVGKSVAGSLLTNKLMVQHVWVDNMGVGGPGGGGPVPGGGKRGWTSLGKTLLKGVGFGIGVDAAASSNASAQGGGLDTGGVMGNIGGGALAGASIAGPIGALAGALFGVAKSVSEVESGLNSRFAANIHGSLDTNLTTNPQTMGGLTSQLAAIDTGIQRINSNPLNVLVSGDALDQLTGMRADIVAAIAAQSEASRANLQPLPDRISEKQVQHFNSLRDKLESTRIATVTRLDAQKNELARVRDRAEATRIATVTGDSAIVAAIRAIRLAVTVTVPVTVNGGYVRSVTTKSGTTLYRVGGNAARGANLGLSG